MLLWAVVIVPTWTMSAPSCTGAAGLYEVLPDASMNTVVNLYNTTVTPVPGTQILPPGWDGAQVAPALAFAVLALYVLVFLAVPAVITARRSIT